MAFVEEMDALKMGEQTGVEHTTQTDHSHACGHDGNCAILMATIEVLVKQVAKIPKNKKIRCLFQPGGESLDGAKMMIADGAMEGVDEVYEIHSIPMGPEHTVATKPDFIMAGSVDFRIEATGLGGHCSEPSGSVDPITALANIHVALHSIRSMHLGSREYATIAVGQFHAGTSIQVIPQSGFMEGKINYFSTDVREKIKARVK